MENTIQKNNQLHESDKELSHTITAICLTILTAMLFYWRATKFNGSPAGCFAALVNAALFAAIGIRFIPLWVGSWRKTVTVQNNNAGNMKSEAMEETTKKSVYIKVFLSFLAVDILIIFLIYLLQILSGKGAPFKEALKLWEATDSGHYLDIAQDWYLSVGHRDRLVQLVFLPGYPLLIRFMNIFIGNYLYSGMIVSGLCFAGAGTMLYILVRLDHSHEYAVRTLKYLCILPGAFFFAAPMSESLFLLLSVSCIYFVRKRNWTAACILAGLASFTRSLGLALLAPILFEMIQYDRKTTVSRLSHNQSGIKLKLKEHIIFKYFNILFIFLGFGAYLLINYQVSGNPFQFMIYQKEHWGQSLGFFFNTASYQTDCAIRTFHELNYQNLFGLWLPNLFSIFSSLIIMLLAVRNMRPGYTAYFFTYYIIAIGATWLLSAPRYLLCLFPISIALADLTEKRWVNKILTLICVILFIIYACMFVNRWQVW